MPTVRPRTAVDVPACVQVLTAVYNNDGYPVQGVDNATEFLTSEATLQAWVAEEDGQIIGHAAVSKASDDKISVKLWQEHTQGKDDSDDVAVLERVFVHPQARGAGAAGRLIAVAAKYASDQSLTLVLIALSKDQGAMRLYERLGWTCFGEGVYTYGDGREMKAFGYVSPKLRS